MKYLIPLLALLLCGCEPVQPAVPTDVVTPPPVVSHVTHFVIIGGNGSWVFSDINTTVTGSYTRVVTVPLTVVFNPASGVVGDWTGDAWSSGNTATILPSDVERTVTVVISPSGRG